MLDKIDALPFVNQKNAFRLMLAMHTAGVIGLALPETRELFQLLTPFNLLATAAIVLHFEKAKNARYGLFITITFLVGFFVEVLGVSTGMIFGEYNYGGTLGIKFLDVPLAIGLNWVILIYCTGLQSKKLFESLPLRIVMGALMMTILDLLIEPVAISYDFWSWETVSIPLQNYGAWFLISAALHLLFNRLLPDSNNSLAIRLLYIQAGFFLILNFI
ncbi:carotenoid biosynthesis protein [Roseivirga sp. E12]|uniref:carotenoid biosynthesis protein n=1 Tax=Roseivirga sp. E12 TaxID=2819237 RepID=UPI001ABC688F|nr:carotenoid biosynthesis protein [Roseivirga sp. E12]MBO3699984.1 carotenoid biosynthesis protein [Roseivirga sp. E12]